jgi:hypothetical protein
MSEGIQFHVELLLSFNLWNCTLFCCSTSFDFLLLSLSLSVSCFLRIHKERFCSCQNYEGLSVPTHHLFCCCIFLSCQYSIFLGTKKFFVSYCLPLLFAYGESSLSCSYVFISCSRSIVSHSEKRLFVCTRVKNR